MSDVIVYRNNYSPSCTEYRRMLGPRHSARLRSWTYVLGSWVVRSQVDNQTYSLKIANAITVRLTSGKDYEDHEEYVH